MLPALDNLIHALAKLPGFGRRSSERAALALVRRPEALLDTLMQALQEAREQICTCSKCGGFTAHEEDPCLLCTRADRDDRQLCIVEDPADIYTLEASGAFRGRYHALMGKLSPGKQTGISELRIAELPHRIQSDGIQEVLLALSTDLEGDATANYIAEKLKSTNVRLTRLAFGLPCGSGVAYADPLTLRRAITGRQSVTDTELMAP
ncbi:MAG: recombination protein RecR [Kiritimatiellae bacterium]|nr:recombination protein RecR [Kiritimatiellia bacterium]